MAKRLITAYNPNSRMPPTTTPAPIATLIPVLIFPPPLSVLPFGCGGWPVGDGLPPPKPALALAVGFAIPDVPVVVASLNRQNLSHT